MKLPTIQERYNTPLEHTPDNPPFDNYESGIPLLKPVGVEVCFGVFFQFGVLIHNLGPSSRNGTTLLGSQKICLAALALRHPDLDRYDRWKICMDRLEFMVERQHIVVYGGFLKWWVYPTTMGFPTKNDRFGVFCGYRHFRKHPYAP